MTFAQRRNRLTTHFSERIPVVKRRVSVLLDGRLPYRGVGPLCRFASRYFESVHTESQPICGLANMRHFSLTFLRSGLSERCLVPAPLTSATQLLNSLTFWSRQLVLPVATVISCNSPSHMAIITNLTSHYVYLFLLSINALFLLHV
jgi:hypothetical protein